MKNQVQNEGKPFISGEKIGNFKGRWHRNDIPLKTVGISRKPSPLPPSRRRPPWLIPPESRLAGTNSHQNPIAVVPNPIATVPFSTNSRTFWHGQKSMELICRPCPYNKKIPRIFVLPKIPTNFTHFPTFDRTNLQHSKTLRKINFPM